MNRLKNLENVAISASVDSRGYLGPVGGWTFKWDAAYWERGFPRISAVVISRDQHFDDTSLEEREKGHIYKVRDTRIYVLCASSVDEAHTLLLKVQRQQGLADSPALEDVPYFTGRTHLTNEVDAFIDAQRTGYLLISGGMGRGKTSFLRHYIYQRRKKTGEPQVCHFIGLAGTREAKRQRIAESLCLQLLNKYPHYEEPEGQGKCGSALYEPAIFPLRSVSTREFGVRVRIPTYPKLHSLFLGPGFRFAMRNARAASICCWKYSVPNTRFVWVACRTALSNSGSMCTRNRSR
jgi:hypothetical protein